MAKFAVVFLAAIAAASAGVLMPNRYLETTMGDYKYGLQYHGYPTGKFDYLFGQLQTVAQDLAVYFQKALPNDRLVLKILTWQSRELAQYIDTILEKLHAETYQYNGEVSMVLEEFITELRDIKTQYQQIAAYTPDAYTVHQMKNQFYMNVQRTMVHLEKLVRLVQTFDQTHGELYFLIKNVITDFLYAFQNIYAHVQYYGVYGEQSPRQLVLQIQDVTSYLIQYFQGVTHFDAHRMYAVREYVQHVEAIISRMQEVEGTYGNLEIDGVLQHVYGKLRGVLMPFMQMYDTKYDMQNVDIVRTQLIKELQIVAEVFEQFFQYMHVGKFQTFFFEILGDYLYTIQQFRMQMMYGGYQTYYHGGYLGNTEYPAMFGKSQGLYSAELYGKTGYPGFYRYGGYGYGFTGKYSGFIQHGQDLKEFQMQFQTIIRDLFQTFKTVSFSDVASKEAFIHMIRQYVRELEFIVDRMHQYVSYNGEGDFYIFQEVAQNLRQYIVALEQFYTAEFPTTELGTQFYMYIQKIATEFERLMYGMKQTHGTFYDLAHNVLYQYFTITYNLYRHMENIHEIARFGYGPYSRHYFGGYYMGDYYGKHFGGQYGQYSGLLGEQQIYETPRELVNKIQYVASDLSGVFQKGMYFNQQHAQILTVHAGHFAQIIMTIIEKLESYQHIDAALQQVIYKLREVQMNFQQLAAYDMLSNVHQFRTEFDNYVQIAVAQIEKLLLIAQEEMHGNFYYVIKDVLHLFYYGLRDIHYQIQQVSQYSHQYGLAKYGQQYGMNYGFSKYGMGYGKYTSGMMGLGQYGYQNQYGYLSMPFGKFLGSSYYNQPTIRGY